MHLKAAAQLQTPVGPLQARPRRLCTVMAMTALSVVAGCKGQWIAELPGVRPAERMGRAQMGPSAHQACRLREGADCEARTVHHCFSRDKIWVTCPLERPARIDVALT